MIPNHEYEESYAIASNIKDRKGDLAQSNIVTVPLNLSQQEVQCLKGINIEYDLNQFDYYGSAGPNLEGELEKYLSQMGENTPTDIVTVSRIIARLAKGMMVGFDAESIWTLVRVSLPNDHFNVPRWHPDGRYFNSDNKVYKLAATLKGAPTLFGEVVDVEQYFHLLRMSAENYTKNRHDRDKFQKEDLRIRREIARVVRQHHILKYGEAAIYLVGDENAAIHSEPDIAVPRIFTSILPGKDVQIEEWRSRK